MNTEVVEQIANAVLYEGYMLYPYRPSAIKNRQRFNFGVLYPREYCALQSGSESSEMKTECLVECAPSSTIEIKIRFLQLAARQEWQEGLEREVCVEAYGLESLVEQALTQSFTFAAAEDSDGRKTESVEGKWKSGPLARPESL
jgi:hypothetical protein